MSKLILALALLIMTSLPPSPRVEKAANFIRNKIDRPVTTQSIPNIDLNIVELKREAKKISSASKAAYFFDTSSGQVLFSQNAESKLPVASLTKMMTALIIVTEEEMDEIAILNTTGTRAGDSSANFKNGDKLTVYELLEGLLITSGSDAALALARHNAGSEPEFVAKMNEKATILGLNNTQFTNPVGWDEPGNYSTAHDMAVLAKIIKQNKVLGEIVQKKNAKITSETGRKYYLRSTNVLLNRNYLGIKTGTTYAAGECYATHYKDDNREIIGVVLNSPNRFSEVSRTINWIKENHIFKRNHSVLP